MATIHKFEDLDAWKAARVLTAFVYEVSSVGSFRRDFGLTDQIRRASVSVMANIAEGFERGGRREFLRFLRIAKASAGEVESHAFVARDLAYISSEKFRDLRGKISRSKQLIAGMIRYLSNLGPNEERGT